MLTVVVRMSIGMVADHVSAVIPGFKQVLTLFIRFVKPRRKKDSGYLGIVQMIQDHLIPFLKGISRLVIGKAIVKGEGDVRLGQGMEAGQ